MECRLEARYTSGRKKGVLSAGGAAKGNLSILFFLADLQSLEAVLTVDMEALEQFGIFEGIKADGTGQLVLQLLEGLLGYGLSFFSGHFD